MRINLGTAANVATLLACPLLVLAVVKPTVFGAPPPAAAIPHPPPLELISGEQKAVAPKEHVAGDPRAKIVLIEFSDFQCPYCGKFARDTFPILQSRYIDKGVVAYGVRHFPLTLLHPLAQDAAKAAECAGAQQQFWTMREQLFRDQEHLTLQDLGVQRDRLGLNRRKFDECMREPSPIVDADLAEGRRLKVVSTPTFIVGTLENATTVRVRSIVHGAQDVSVFQKAIEDAREASRVKG